MATTKKEVPIGQLIDAVYVARTARLDAEKHVETLKEAERAAKHQVIARLTSMKLNSARGDVATATITMKQTAVMNDWPKFWEFARKDKNGAYLQKRASLEAVREYNNDSKKGGVPGVVLEDVVDLSLTKAPRA